MKLTLQEAKDKYESKFIIFKETSEDFLVVSVCEKNNAIMVKLSHSLSIEKGKSSYNSFDINIIEDKFSMKK